MLVLWNPKLWMKSSPLSAKVNSVYRPLYIENSKYGIVRLRLFGLFNKCAGHHTKVVAII